jgi:hypothetical protein
MRTLWETGLGVYVSVGAVKEGCTRWTASRTEQYLIRVVIGT